MKRLVYTQYGQNMGSLCLPWMDWPQYLDQNNQQISSIQFFSMLKWAQGFPFSVQQCYQQVKQTLQ